MSYLIINTQKPENDDVLKRLAAFLYDELAPDITEAFGTSMHRVLSAMDDDGVLIDYITAMYSHLEAMAMGAHNYMIPEVAEGIKEVLWTPQASTETKKLRVTLTPGDDYEGYIEMDRKRYGANGVLVISTSGPEESVYGDF